MKHQKIRLTNHEKEISLQLAKKKTDRAFKCAGHQDGIHAI